MGEGRRGGVMGWDWGDRGCGKGEREKNGGGGVMGWDGLEM